MAGKLAKSRVCAMRALSLDSFSPSYPMTFF